MTEIKIKADPNLAATEPDTKMRPRDWWMLALVFAVLVGAGFCVGVFVGVKSAPSHDDGRPGFYCNGTTAVYYTKGSFTTVPFAGECGGVG